jgi:hypothetical protein
MSKQAIAFHEFATRKAHSGNFADVADVRKHYSELQYKSWFDSTVNEYRNYLTESFPTMTLAQAAALTAEEPQNV